MLTNKCSGMFTDYAIGVAHNTLHILENIANLSHLLSTPIRPHISICPRKLSVYMLVTKSTYFHNWYCPLQYRYGLQY